VKDRWRKELFFQIEELKITVRKSRELVEGLGVGAKRRGSHQGDPREFSSARKNNLKGL